MAATASWARLDDRGVIGVDGADARDFLQGLVSNDVRRVSAARAIHAAFLTPQGKYLHDFFIAESNGTLLLECERGRAADLVRLLTVYRLRSRVALADRSQTHAVFAAFGEGAELCFGLAPEPGAAAGFVGGTAYVDPRLAAIGVRLVLQRGDASAILERVGCVPAAPEDYDRRRIALGLPDGSRDLEVGKAILLENGFAELNGIDWDKGCYLGQELTARTRYRGLVRKRLMPVIVEGPLPPPGTPVISDGKEVGEIRSGRDGMALAMIRLEALARAGEAMTAGGATVTPRLPAWARLPVPDA